ncbi:hypothetical protein [Eikenella corrodens]|uniref:hypothetical protein n=1 Tax=Eikenella corrodens TaxID=539 RepID=UPI00129A5F81|nr:hypothetical protein [Eikenella corrodens]
MSDPNKIQPPKKGIEMVKGGGYPAKAVSTSVQQHTAPIQTDMYLIGSKAVQWALIGLAFYAALRLFRSVIMNEFGFRKSRKEDKESEALNENGLENLDQDLMSEPLEEFEGLDGEEPPDNMPDSPEEDPGLQYDLDQHNQEVYDNSPQWYRDLVDSGQFDEQPEPVGPPTREEMAINLISYDGAREMQDEDWEYVQVIAERLETESPEEIEEHLINLDLGILESEEEN